MANVLVEESSLSAIADSIRAKNGTETTYKPAEMSGAIDALPTGGGTMQSKSVSYTPTETAQSGTVTPDVGYDGLSSVSVSVGAIDDEYVGSGVTRRSVADLDLTGATFTAPEGYYASDADKTMMTGHMSVSATKGTVSNHAVTVTPKAAVDNAGYFATGDRTGTAVSVSASELVSGSETKTQNGTYDVTNLAELVVNVSAPAPSLQTKSVSYTPTTSSQSAQVTPDTGYDGLSKVNVSVAAMPSGTAGTPTATKGTVSNHSVSVTPSVTNTTGYITGSTKTGTAVTVSASELVSGSETKTQNGTYDVTNLETLVVSVSGGSVQYDTKTATASDYPVSLSFSSMKGEPKAFVLRLNAQVSSSGSTTYYYIVDICAFGTTTHGNCFRIGSTRRVDNITSGYSWSYSGTTLTVTSSSSSRSASPGAFYSGSYELMYVY